MCQTLSLTSNNDPSLWIALPFYLRFLWSVFLVSPLHPILEYPRISYHPLLPLPHSSLYLSWKYYLMILALNLLCVWNHDKLAGVNHVACIFVWLEIYDQWKMMYHMTLANILTEVLVNAYSFCWGLVSNLPAFLSPPFHTCLLSRGCHLIFLWVMFLLLTVYGKEQTHIPTYLHVYICLSFFPVASLLKWKTCSSSCWMPVPFCVQPPSVVCCCWVAKSCPTLCHPMDCSMPGFPVPHNLLELAQVIVYWIRDAIQPSQPVLPPSPPAFNLSQYQRLFQ